jgi:3-hydroxybutyryl-CoA dehydratase
MTMNIYDIRVGDTATYTKTIDGADVILFSSITGAYNSMGVCDSFAGRLIPLKKPVNEDLVSGFISAVLESELPGPGSSYVEQSMEFVAPVYIGDTITARVEVIALDMTSRQITLLTRCTNQNGTEVIRGEALMRPDAARR